MRPKIDFAGYSGDMYLIDGIIARPPHRSV
jgi:hypothetical protein